MINDQIVFCSSKDNENNDTNILICIIEMIVWRGFNNPLFYGDKDQSIGLKPNFSNAFCISVKCLQSIKAGPERGEG